MSPDLGPVALSPVGLSDVSVLPMALSSRPANSIALGHDMAHGPWAHGGPMGNPTAKDTG